MPKQTDHHFTQQKAAHAVYHTPHDTLRYSNTIALCTMHPMIQYASQRELRNAQGNKFSQPNAGNSNRATNKSPNSTNRTNQSNAG